MGVHKGIFKLRSLFSGDRSNSREIADHVLDKVTLLLGRGVDGGTGGSLGLLATGHGSPGTGEDGAENSHGEL